MDYSIVLLVFFLLTTLSYGNLQDFAACMAYHSSTSTSSSVVHSQESPSYAYLLQESQQNPRWLNSTSLLKPSFVVTPKTQNEIQGSILCAKKHGLQVRVMSGGHDYEGLSFLCKNPFIILDLVDYRSINIDIENETAWIQSGATIGEVYYDIAKKSDILGFPAGLCPSVGVGGHFSGGGIGTMMRKYGLSADNIIDANLVDANGRILNRGTMGEDVFWAIRGGGGASFGVISAWKVKLVRVPPLISVMNTNFTELGLKMEDCTEMSWIKSVLYFTGYQKGEPFEVLIFTMNRSFPELGLKTKDCTEMSWIKSVLYFTGYQKGEPLEVLLDRKTQYKSNFKEKKNQIQCQKVFFRGFQRGFLHQKLNEVPGSDTLFPHTKGNIYNIQHIVKWDSNSICIGSKVFTSTWSQCVQFTKSYLYQLYS